MIEECFDPSKIDDEGSTNFAVHLRDGAGSFFIPTDARTKSALVSVLNSTVSSFSSLTGEWERFDVSEDYGAPRKVYLERGHELLASFNELLELVELEDLSNLDDAISSIDFYYAHFRNRDGQECVGVKRARQFKSVLGARGRLVRLVDDTMRLVEDNVVRLDRIFDVVACRDYIFIYNPWEFDYLADIVNLVAGSAADKVKSIDERIEFLDLSRMESRIGDHPRLARTVASVAARRDLEQLDQEKLVPLAERHGVKFLDVEGKKRCRIQDHGKLLEVLDARRYLWDLTNEPEVPYRATGRSRVKS